MTQWAIKRNNKKKAQYYAGKQTDVADIIVL